MPEIRDLETLNPDSQHVCDGIHIESYEMEEVILPSFGGETNVKAIKVSVQGRNFKSVAQPLLVFVGEAMLQFVRIAPDENSVEGILLNEPKPRDSIVIQLGDQDAVRHPEPVDIQAIRRID